MGAGEQEAAHLGSAVVEDAAVPVRVVAEAGVGVFVEVGAVEDGEPVGIVGEVRRHPVENHPDPGLVQGVDQGHEVDG